MDRSHPDSDTTRRPRGQRFERWMRVRRGADFSQAYRRGGRARGNWFTIVAAPNDLGHTRFGLSIGKRAWRGAVPRNRLRRILREAFRLTYAELPEGHDLIAVGSTPEAHPTLEQAKQDLVRLAREAVERRGKRRGKRRRSGGESKPATDDGREGRDG
ncbi:MAG: ribonuclease P protein component [Planctomycetota bacterium]